LSDEAFHGDRNLHKGLVEYLHGNVIAGVVLGENTPREADALARAWAETRWGWFVQLEGSVE
jgi:hypothetical protein